MFKFLWDLMKEWLESLGSYIWKFFTEFYEQAFTSLIALIETAMSSVGNPTDLSWTVEVYETINYFFPLNESLALLTVYLSVWSIVFSTKIILKLFPGVY